jgi:hypothetical protein
MAMANRLIITSVKGKNIPAGVQKAVVQLIGPNTPGADDQGDVVFITSVSETPNEVMASGTVSDGGDPTVVCTLTDDTTHTRVAQKSVPVNADLSWSVDFTKVPNGCYTLGATNGGSSDRVNVAVGKTAAMCLAFWGG